MNEQINIFSFQEKNWNSWIVRYDLKQLRKESLHLLKKSKQRPLSSWEIERMSVLSHEIGMLLVAAQNFELEDLLAA